MDNIEEFMEEEHKRKRFSIRMDITMDKEMTYEEADQKIWNALRSVGVVGHCGGIY